MFDMDQIKKNVVKWSKPDTEENEMIQSVPATQSSTTTSRISSTSSPATIGSSIYFKGELSGEEDFIIQGKVDGEIKLQKNNLTIGIDGVINANITARIIIVEGQLNGDLTGSENVIIRKTGNVLGNIISPRVTLEDGAKFKGSIEMDPKDSTVKKSNDLKINH
ncbi:MAG: polymer-forming cytoskeletal protein [Thiohalomonadales bacterium]